MTKIIEWGRFSAITKSWKRIFLFLLAIGVVVYANSWGNQLFWDDLDNFVNNRYVHSWEYFDRYFSENLIAGSNLSSNYWRPMMLIVWSVCWSFWQDWGGGYRIVNLLLHTGCGVLVYQLLNKLFEKKGLSLCVAVIFVIHPLQTEAITYASGISDPLSGVFILGSIYSYLKFRIDGYKWGWLIALGLMTLGLLSRETVVVLPAVIGALELYLYLDKRVEKTFGGWIRKVIILVGGFGVVSATYLYLRATVLNFGGTFNIYQEENEFTRHPEYRLLTFWKVLALFVGLLVWPIGLHMDRLIAIESDLSNWQVWLGILATLLSIGIVVIGTRNFGKWKVVLFGLVWFWMWLFPVSNLVIPVNGLMFEHWMYLPLIGFWTVVVYLVEQVIKEKYRWIGIIMFCILVIWFGCLTILRNIEWAEATTFYTQVLSYNPTSLRIWNNLGMTYADRGQLDKAIPNYEKASALDPTNWVPLHNIGNAYRGKGDLALAMEYYLLALDKNPDSYVTMSMMYKMVTDNNRLDWGKEVFAKLLEKHPANVNMLLVMIGLSIEDKDQSTAKKYWRQLSVVDSTNPVLLDLNVRIENLNAKDLDNNSGI